MTGSATFDWADEGWRVASTRHGVAVEEVLAQTGFAPIVPDHVEATPPPPAAVLDLLRTRVDPHGLGRLEVRETRGAAAAELARLRPAR